MEAEPTPSALLLMLQTSGERLEPAGFVALPVCGGTVGVALQNKAVLGRPAVERFDLHGGGERLVDRAHFSNMLTSTINTRVIDLCDNVTLNIWCLDFLRCKSDRVSETSCNVIIS